MIEGEYSIDGGEWQTIDNDHPINEHFHKAVFKGKLTRYAKSHNIMNIISKNVWYTLYDSEGKAIDGNDRRQEETPENIEYLGERLKRLSLRRFLPKRW